MSSYQTENIIIAVMDGARWSETFGDPTKKICPHLHNDLAPGGVNYTNCLNTGQTITRQGHSTIISGTWQRMQLQGPRLNMPSLFEYFRDETGEPATSCWTIFGKGLYAFEQPSSHPGYGQKYGGYQVHGEDAPFHEHGLDGDVRVTDEVFKCMDRYQPRILFVNWGHPDCAGHRLEAGIEQYQNAVQNCDAQLMRLWEGVQEHPHYAGKTTVVFLNDHGRAAVDWSRHGIPDPECKHCICLWLGPDTPRNVTVDEEVYLTDIAPTCAELLGIQTPLATGKIMVEVFRDYQRINVYRPATLTAICAVAIEKQARRPDLEVTVARYALGKHPPLSVTNDFGGELLMLGLDRLQRDAAYPISFRKVLRQYIRRWVDINASGMITKHADAFVASLDSRLSNGWAATAYQNLQKAPSDPPPGSNSMDLIRAAFVLAARQSVDWWPVECPESLELFEQALLQRDQFPWHPLDNAEWCYRVACLHRLFVPNEASQRLRQHYLDILVRLLERNPEVGMLWDDPILSAIYTATFKFGLAQCNPKQIEFWRALHLAARTYFRAGNKNRGDSKLGVSGYMVTRHIRIISRRGAQHMTERLRYLVNKDGKFGDGSPLAQGAFLTVFNAEPWRYGGKHPYANRIDPSDEDETRATAPWEVTETETRATEDK